MLATQILSDSLPSIYPTYKTCSKCHQSKLLCEFHKEKTGKYGVRADCKVCRNDCKKTHYQANRERYIETSKVWREKNPEYSKVWREKNPEYSKTHYQSNRERNIEYSKAWNKVNRERKAEYDRSYGKVWAKNNPDKVRSINARRRAAKRNAFPMWARTGEIKTQIDAIYTEAKDLELFHQTAYHVDHIVPLQSNFVCGLHVPANLQPLPGIENISKNNSFTPYIENATDVEIDMVELRQMVKEFLELETFVRMYMYIKTTSFLKLL